MTILYSNDFEADSTGAAPSGWYGVFKVQSGNADATVSGSKAMLAYGEYDGYKSVYRGIAARTEADYRVKQKAQFNGGALLLQSLMHGDDLFSSVTVSNAYFCRVTAASASSVSLGLKRCIGTSFDETYQTTGSHSWSVSTGDVICQRLVIDGSNVKHYIWNESNESEPSTPTLEYTDTTERPAGYLYIVYNNGGGVVATGFDDVTISDLSANADAYASTTPYSLTLTAPTASAAGTGATQNVSATATFAAVAISAPVATASGTSASAGTITTPVLKNNTGTVLASQTGITAHIYAVSSGDKVVTLTGQTTNASGVMTLSDVLIVSGTQYRVVIVLGSGAEGMEKLTAS